MVLLRFHLQAQRGVQSLHHATRESHVQCATPASWLAKQSQSCTASTAFMMSASCHGLTAIIRVPSAGLSYREKWCPSLRKMANMRQIPMLQAHSLWSRITSRCALFTSMCQRMPARLHPITTRCFVQVAHQAAEGPAFAAGCPATCPARHSGGHNIGAHTRNSAIKASADSHIRSSCRSHQCASLCI